MVVEWQIAAFSVETWSVLIFVHIVHVRRHGKGKLIIFYCLASTSFDSQYVQKSVTITTVLFGFLHLVSLQPVSRISAFQDLLHYLAIFNYLWCYSKEKGPPNTPISFTIELSHMFENVKRYKFLLRLWSTKIQQEDAAKIHASWSKLSEKCISMRQYIVDFKYVWRIMTVYRTKGISHA